MHYAYIINERTPGREVILYRTLDNARSRRFLRRVGLILLTISFLSIFVILSPIIFSEISFRLTKYPSSAQVGGKEKVSLFGNLLWLNSQDLSSPLDWNFGLIIPKIGINTKVSPNIDPYNKDLYNQVLKSGVAHAKGTSFPSQLGTTYIFGHSSNLIWDVSRQNAVFYLLKNLDKNDEIILFYNNQRYVYRVTEKTIASANDVPLFVSQTDKSLLVLQTCWPPGTDWKRLFVLAEPVENKSLSSTKTGIGL